MAVLFLDFRGTYSHHQDQLSFCQVLQLKGKLTRRGPAAANPDESRRVGQMVQWSCPTPAALCFSILTQARMLRCFSLLLQNDSIWIGSVPEPKLHRDAQSRK